MRVSLQNIFNIYRFLCVRDPFTYRHSIAISTVSVLLFTFDSLNRIQTKRLSFKKKDGVNQTHRLFYHIKRFSYNSSTSLSHACADASLGIRQSPRGERQILPTFTPSGMQLRLNCCEKKRR